MSTHYPAKRLFPISIDDYLALPAELEHLYYIDLTLTDDDKTPPPTDSPDWPDGYPIPDVTDRGFNR